MADTFPQPSLWGEGTAQRPSRLGAMLVVSLLLHLAVLIAVGGLRLSAKGERPLTSYQVSLVTLPSQPLPPPVRRAVEPETPVAPPPAPTQAVPKPAPKPAPPPAVKPSVTKTVVEPPPPPPPMRAPKSEQQIKDLLRGIKLPPQAPKLGDLAPAEKSAPMQQVSSAKAKQAPQKLKKEIDELLNNLAVPEREAPPVPKETPLRPSQREALTKQVQNLQLQPQGPKPVEEAVAKPPLPAPAQTAKAATSSTPATKMQVPGVATGTNAYLALVQRMISNQWIAPPVDLTGKVYKVVVKFRLDRSGAVSAVTVETSSGNGYFDDAATRAVLKAHPLPPFPKDMFEQSVDAHFSFVVGEEVG